MTKTRMNARMTPSDLNSPRECRSWMLYHFVHGTADPVGTAPTPAKDAGVGEDAEKPAGAGSGAPAKSAKSVNGQLSSSSIVS